MTEAHTAAPAEPRLNRRQQSKARTVQRLLDVARTMFAAHAYEAVTIRGLAAEAGVSTGAVFANFRDKADLWRVAMGCEPPVDDVESRQRQRRMARALELIAGADFWTDDTGVEMTLLARWALGVDGADPDTQRAVQARFEIHYAAARLRGAVDGDPAELARAEITELSAEAPF